MPRRAFIVDVTVMDERFGPDHEFHLRELVIDDQLDIEAYGHVERQIRRMVLRLHDQLEPQPVRRPVDAFDRMFPPGTCGCGHQRHVGLICGWPLPAGATNCECEG